MAALNPRLTKLSDHDLRVLDSWLVEFDQRWDEGLLANRLDQIPPGSAWRLPALAEMVKIDLERQWRRGRQVSLESYLKQFPELGSPADVSADLIQAEYEVRRQFGAPARPRRLRPPLPASGRGTRPLDRSRRLSAVAPFVGRRGISLFFPSPETRQNARASSPNSLAGTGSSSGWARAAWVRSTWPRIPTSNARWP